MRCWQYKHNYKDTYLHTYILIFAQPHKNKLKYLFLKKANKTEWLLQQNHRVGGMIGATTERKPTVHQECC